MKPKHFIDADYMKYRLDYDPSTGEFRWKNCNPTSNRRNWFNTNFLCKIAGYEQPPDFYRKINIDGRLLGAHRIAWVMMTGDNPVEEIDHVNGDARDNRWSNLRLATHSQNGKNTKLHKTNTSGYKGVCFDIVTGKWLVQIMCDGKRHKLGLFDDPAHASMVYEKTAEEMFGKFKRMDTHPQMEDNP